MLEGLVAWVLNNYLGKYVENLNTTQLSIALLQGSVELENLPLRKDALRHFGLPVQLKYGLIGKIKLKVPVTQLRSAPWIIAIDHLTIVLKPSSIQEWDEEAEENAAYESKLSLLDSFEADWKASSCKSAQENSYYASSYYSWFNYGSGVVTNIIENIQLEIKNVHIRYEDDVTLDRSFSMGIKIDSLSIRSCNEQWSPGYRCRDAGDEYSFQLLQLREFSVYIDEIPETQFWDVENFDLGVVNAISHNFILPPVSAEARIKRNRSSETPRASKQPRIICDLQLETFSILLTDTQYTLTVSCSKGLKRIQRCRKYIRFRPLSTVKEDPKAWWIYCFNCFRYNQRGSIQTYIQWDECLLRARENISYVKLYVDILSNSSASSAIDPPLKELKNKVEWEREFEDLRALREVAMSRVKSPKTAPVTEKLNDSGRSTLFKWFPQWMGWYSTPEATPEQASSSTSEDAKINSQLESIEDEILDVIKDSVENNTIFRRGQFNFTLKEGNIKLISDSISCENSDCVMELLVDNVRLELESRPVSSSSRFYLSLGGIILNDHLTQNSIFPVLISPQSSGDAPSGKVNRYLPPTLAKLLPQTTLPVSSNNKPLEPLFQLTYEYKPFRSSFDYKLHIESKSLDVVYNPEAIKWLLDFFVKPHQSSDTELKRAAKLHYYSMKQKTKEEFLKNWDNILQGRSANRKLWDIKLNISAPQIFLVEHFADKNTIICIIDFGKLFFTNNQDVTTMDPNPDQPVTQTSADMDMSENDEDSEEFATPCSTPAASEVSDLSDSRKVSLDEISKNITNSINESNFHCQIYESYKVEFNDLQVLLGRMKDNWKFAHLKGASSLHVLDRFNISLQIERRVIYTTDPLYPALMILGNLPKLIVHANEHKIQALKSIYDTVVGYWAQTPFRTPDTMNENFMDDLNSDVVFTSPQDVPDAAPSIETSDAKLFIIQFIVDQLSLEIQSRGRSIAELQVSGVRALFTKRPLDTSLSLSVHSLLLVDALQTFGPDFELLLASHKHIGMDSISGSLKDSDPTSPVSPSSPDPAGRNKATSPVSLLHALSSLNVTKDESSCEANSSRLMPVSPIGDAVSGTATMHTFSDSEALILVDIVFIRDRNNSSGPLNEDMQIASIQFNNLDVVANQETIVELISFTKRILSQFHFNQKYFPKDMPSEAILNKERFSSSSPIEVGARSSLQIDTPKSPPALTKTELTFDFHRLNILLLRSLNVDGGLTVAKKIATATMTDAKINATVGDNLSVDGSLGGLQVLDMTNDGRIHQCIFSVGQDPVKVERPVMSREKKHSGLFDHLSADVYNMKSKASSDKTSLPSTENVQALNFSVDKSLKNQFSEEDYDTAIVKIRFSSALYTHAPHFVAELSTYATEFKQYLKNLARSIGSAATEMALGLVHARTEALAQSLNIGHRQSVYGSYSELAPNTPRKQWMRSPSVDLPTEVNTSFNAISPADYEVNLLKIKLDVVIDSPIIIMPRFATSYEVFVAHLGRITVNNENSDEVTGDRGFLWTVKDRYNIEVRDMNLYSLNVENRLQPFKFTEDMAVSVEHFPPSVKVESIYDCQEEGKPILHDTVIHLFVERDLKIGGQDVSDVNNSTDDEHCENIQVCGGISTPLRFSLTRQQYEQLIDTVDNILASLDKSNSAPSENNFSVDMSHLLLPNISEDSELRSNISALDLDPALRAKMLQRHSSGMNVRRSLTLESPGVMYKVNFGVPVVTVELLADFGSGEKGLVELSFKDFTMQFEQCNQFETAIQMSLQSLVMEDLQREPNSKHRFMMMSSTKVSEEQVNADFISTSCPSFSECSTSYTSAADSKNHSSLPDYLEMETIFGGFVRKSRSSYRNKNDLSGKSVYQRTKSADPYPCTPPPSPREGRSSSLHNEENLVHISVVLYSKDSEQFFSDKLVRTVNVDFNSLDIIVNVQSWVVVLDFFGLADDQIVSSQPIVYSKPVSRKQSEVSLLPNTTYDSQCIQRWELDISVRSLSLLLNRTEYEVAKANICRFDAHIIRDTNSEVVGDVTMMNGHLGTMSLFDMTPTHGDLYHERFITTGLDFYVKRYSKPDRLFTREYDIDLKLDMPSVTYVHTQRFASDLQLYYKHFTQLQKIFNNIRSASKLSEDWDLPTRVRLNISASSPVIILPVSSQHKEVLIADLGNLTVTNSFRWTDSTDRVDPDDTQISLLDVMEVNLVNMDLFTGQWVSAIKEDSKECRALNLGSYFVKNQGASLLDEKCKLKLKVERNLSVHIHKSVPALSFTGVLSTLALTVDLSEYILLQGLLRFNIGECLDDLFAQDEDMASVFNQDWDTNVDFVWCTNCLNLDLVDVSVRLLSASRLSSSKSLACVNFVKSHLSVETFSDKAQDIDLVSQEILITDTRFIGEPVNKRSNIFTNILQPLSTSNPDNVRVEVHHRQREDSSKFTILLNNMRLMTILDWWEMVRDFVLCDLDLEIPVPKNVQQVQDQVPPAPPAEVALEVKLNITNSEVVLLEDTTLWDSNAVIFKSTTVINYKPNQPDKILSCNFNHCELFSCILGMEDETALSIVDPVTINCELATRSTDHNELTKVLQISSPQLYLRLSYHDVCMFMRILQSLPNQTAAARSHSSSIDDTALPANIRNQVIELQNLGFSSQDCLQALEKCGRNLDDAALWLTQNAVPVDFSPNFAAVRPEKSVGMSTYGVSTQDILNFRLLELKTECLNVCIIDDCQDSDVPLLELSLAHLFFKKDFYLQSGTALCLFSLDYYNRFLSGWEPFLEPWSCHVNWSRASPVNLSPKRLTVNLKSEDILKINVTKTLVDLFKNVKKTWTEDYYNPKEKIDGDSGKHIGNSGFRRRSPFIPFALKNETGCVLSMSTSVAAGNSASLNSADASPSNIDEDSVWSTVGPGDTYKFSFEEREKRRHRDTHMVKCHQVTVKILGWKPVKPVSVDRVGVYFRHALPDHGSIDGCDLPQARIVFDVTLEGSARKLITVRSALLLHNQLQLPIEMKLENTRTIFSRDASPLIVIISPGTCEPVPLAYTHAQISVRPVVVGKASQIYYAFSEPIFWQRAQRLGDLIEEIRQCHSNKGSSYRFCAVIRRENYPYDQFYPQGNTTNGIWTHPGHLISFISPMLIVNLLPYDLYYNANDVENGRIYPGQQISLHEVSNDLVTEIVFFLESYPGAGRIVIPSSPTTFTTKVRLHDHRNRKLLLNVLVSVKQGSEIQVTVYASYWLINRTALPLVFRQEGGFDDTAGQYEEHEIARMVAPLMFSHADPEASPTVVARVGTATHADGRPQWCHHFHLHVGVQVRRLRVVMNDPSRPEKVYMIGIHVRQGRGRYRDTFIVTLSAHYQILNKSSFTLELAQKYCASTVSDPGAEATHVQATPNCTLPYHWPRLEKEQILCLRIVDVPGCLWSGGFKVKNDAFHINVRDQEGRMNFLRVEIVLQEATYFVIFTNAETMPPPVRIDNFSQVNLHFHQMMSEKFCMVRAHSSIPYAWDEPLQSHTLSIIAPGGVSASYNVNQLGKAADLTYENFIYIAFAATFNNVSEDGSNFDMLDVQQQQLVLDVIPDSDRIVLNRKEIGARSQFWRMTSSGELQHEGSSPPLDPRSNRRTQNDNVLVLDIAGPALQPKECMNLALRKPSLRRKSTQTWRFTEDGRLCCAHKNMCVQARDGFFGLRIGNDAVLGPAKEDGIQLTENGIPFEQAVCRQKLRPGSGFLSVNITTDGPTRVIEITDIQDRKTCALVKDCDWVYVDKLERPPIISKDSVKPAFTEDFEVNVECSGLGLSLISRKPPEELLYCRMYGIRSHFVRSHGTESVELMVKDVQIDNQLFETPCDVLLFVMPHNRNTEVEEMRRPALQVSCERMRNYANSSSRAEIIKSLLVRVKNLVLILEERLLLKLVAFFGYSNNDQELVNLEENDFETQKILADVASVHSKRYYFEVLEIVLGQVRMTMMTNSKLTPSLREIKKKLGFRLLKFEDATVDLKPFIRFHFFETSLYLMHVIATHFQDELKWQAAVILGSVDFLGNPLGFMNDLHEGVSGLIYEGNIGGLVQNVTHGLSNSAAKVTGTLSDGLGLLTMDEEHEETRRKIRNVKSGNSGGHLVAGVKGLGYGILGGFTSVVKQTCEGVSNKGALGAVTGLGKGLVGTITKPVAGVLDLASETASAVRDSIKNSSKMIPARVRKPRCSMGPTGLLPVYSEKQSVGQEILYSLNNHNYHEVFIAYEILRSNGDYYQIIVSSEMVRVLTRANHIVLQTRLSDLYVCQPLIQDTGRESLVYVELFVRSDNQQYRHSDNIKRPRIRCDKESTAAWISEQVNYARNMYIERQHTLVPLADNLGDD